MFQNLLVTNVLAIALLVSNAQAQILIDEGAQAPTTQPRVGTGAATDYFKKREGRANDRQESEQRSFGGDDRYMMLQLGTFLNDKAYRWGQNKVEDVGEATLGVTYRVGEWRSSMDMLLRAELMSYSLPEGDPLKLSLMPIIAFPDARSNFPLYFGVGGGLGIFFEQIGDESDLSFDYAVITGLRFPDLFPWGGLVMETGLKGQVHLLSSGQQDGVFLSVGTVFIF